MDLRALRDSVTRCVTRALLVALLVRYSIDLWGN